LRLLKDRRQLTPLKIEMSRSRGQHIAVICSYRLTAQELKW